MTAQASWTSIDLAREGNFAVGALCVRPAAREVEALAGTATLEPRVMQAFLAGQRERPPA